MGLRLALALTLVVLTVGVYAQAANHSFVNLDDSAYVAGNRYLSEPLTLTALAGDFSRITFANWSPLTSVSYRLNYAVHGIEFAGYLWTNLALHLLATLLLFRALDRMTGRAGPSAFVAAVFAIHPLHVESVVWISSRKDVLAGCFWMAGLLAYARYAERPASWGRYAAVLACLLLGLLSKPLLVTFPFVLLLLDTWPLRRLSRRALLEKLPMFALVGVISAITVWVQRDAGADAFAAYYDLSLGSRLANGIDAVAGYLRQSFWPSGLAVHYPHPRDTLSAARVVSGAALLVAVSAVALRGWRTRPSLLVGWLWFLGVLVPMLGILQVGSQARADRYMYIPLVGLSIALAWGVLEAVERLDLSRRFVGGLAVAAVVVLAAVSFVQVGTWQSSETLLARAVAVAPDGAFGHKGLGLVRMEQERWQEAEQHLARSWQLRPDLGGPALVRLYRLEARRALPADDWEEFRRRLEQVLEVEPDDTGTYGQLGAVYAREGRLADARAMLERALADPGAPASTYASMAGVEWSAGNRAESAEWSWAVLERDSDHVWAVHNLAWILATSRDPELRDPEEAVVLAESLLAPDDDPDANLLDTVAAAYAAAGRSEEAVATAERGVALAEASGDAALAATLREHRELYRSGGSLAEP